MIPKSFESNIQKNKEQNIQGLSKLLKYIF